MLEDRHQAKRSYAFLSNPHVTHSALLSGHVATTAERCSAERVVLLIADTSELDFSTHRAVRGLGPTRDSFSLGLLVHTTLAVSADRHDVLGVVDQFLWTRPDGASKRSLKESTYQRKGRPRESERWSAAVRRVQDTLSGLASGTVIEPVRYIVLGDRETDHFDLFTTAIDTSQGFIFRVYQNRLLFSQDEQPPRHLIDEVRAAPVRASKFVTIPARAGRAARVACLGIRGTQVVLAPPQSPDGRRQPVKANIVAGIEIDPPSGVEPLCWYLLTTEPIDSPEQLLQIVHHYEARWLIEELHMGMKSGCATEERQFESRHAIENFLAFAVVVAVTLLRLRDFARRPEPASALAVLTATQLEVLKQLRPKLIKGGTARDALRAIATLGGFMGRKGDGEPGWRTLWRGFQKLLLMEEGYRLFRDKP